MDQVIQALAVAALTAFLIFIGVIMGFLMGWKAARPNDKLITREFNPGSTDEPEGDIWQDAMMTEAEKDERISTV